MSVTGRVPNARAARRVPNTRPAFSASAFAFAHGLSIILPTLSRAIGVRLA